MLSVIVNVGIPGSGKSTDAKNIAAKCGHVRVNKDDIRSMIHGTAKHSKAREKQTESARDALMVSALTDGKSVIIDDTNLSPRHFNHIRQLCDRLGSDIGEKIHVEKKWFLDSLNIDLCHKRNTQRDAVVPYDVIERMYQQFMKIYIEEKTQFAFPMVGATEHLPDAVIFDIDGTLAHMNGRSPYAMDRVGEDSVDPVVSDYLKYLYSTGVDIIILSGRDNSARYDTVEWLEKHDIVYGGLYMREVGDNRHDWQVKFDLYSKYVYPRYQTKLVVDDRRQVVRMWRAMGLRCFSVAEGMF